MLSKAKKQKIKDKALIELFNDERLTNTIEYVCIKHQIPLNADIQSDIKSVVFENLIKYDLDKFVEAYQDEPDRILKLAKKMVLWKGVYQDKRCKKSWMHTIAQQIIHQSTLNTLEHIDSIDESTDDFNLPQADTNDLLIRNEDEENEIQMWEYVRSQLTNLENEVLDVALLPTPPKMKGTLKKQYQALLPKLKIIITEYNKTN